MAICSKLAVDKVCKTTIVSMDIKHSHLEAGLVHSQGHWNFKAPTSTDQLQETNANIFNTGNFEDILDFKQLPEDAAAEINSDSDTEDDEPLGLVCWHCEVANHGWNIIRLCILAKG